MKKKIKVLSLILSLMVAGSMFYGCGKKEKPTLNFINYGENIGDGVLEEFEEKYGIQLTDADFKRDKR